jgi:agmatine deiminase
VGQVQELAARYESARDGGEGFEAPAVRCAVQRKNFIIEGGGIEVNGRGTLLTTEECYQHPTVQVRNPGMTKAQYDAQFKKYLGVTNVLWLAQWSGGRRHARAH